jgi:Domain of unknown function (DUF4190)
MSEETIPPPPPPPVPQPTPRTAPTAVWSLVLAILSFTCGWLVTAIPAMICGHVARSKIRKSGGALGGKGIATTGLILGYVALVLGAMGIPLLVSMMQSERERLHRLAIEPKEIASDDGKLKITTSGFWVKRSDLNKGASLQAAYKEKEMYVIVITLTIDEHPALQDELSGMENRTNMVFLHTTVMTAIISNRSWLGRSSHAGNNRTNCCAKLPARFAPRNRRDSDPRSR